MRLLSMEMNLTGSHNLARENELACFSPRQTLLPDAAFCEIGKLRSEREYYANGKKLEFDATFFERHLRTEPVTNWMHHHLR